MYLFFFFFISTNRSLSLDVRLLIRDHLDLRAHLANRDHEVCKVNQASMVSPGVRECPVLQVPSALKASLGIEARMACLGYLDRPLVELSLY